MILVDANVLVAAAHEGDTLHEVAVDVLRDCPEDLLVVATVLAEACYLINKYVGVHGEASLLDAFTDEDFHLAELTTQDLTRAAALLRQYASLDIGAADASLIAVAERLRITQVATFDHRHFAVEPDVEPGRSCRRRRGRSRRGRGVTATAD